MAQLYQLVLTPNKLSNQQVGLPSACWQVDRHPNGPDPIGHELKRLAFVIGPLQVPAAKLQATKPRRSETVEVRLAPVIGHHSRPSTRRQPHGHPPAIKAQIVALNVVVNLA